MSLAAVVEPVIVLHTVFDLLVPLILPSATDRSTACHAALDLLSDHHLQTREELRLSAEIIGFSLQSLAALKDAAEPGIPLSRAMRLRASACALRRSETASQRKLDALQRTSHAAETSQESAIAVALKNASAYFANAYTTAREMGDAQPTANPPPGPAEHPTRTPAAPQAAPPTPAATTPQTQTAKTPAQDPHPQAPRPYVQNLQPARPAPAHAAAATPQVKGRIDAALQRMAAELSDFQNETPDTEEPKTDILAALRSGMFNGVPRAPAA